jgi:hypothetical protein
MLPDTDDAAVQADAYIDALLTGHRRSPVALTADSQGDGPLGREPGVRDAIRLLEKGLPRFHPSFLFEEWLAEQLRRQAARATSGDGNPSAQIIPIAVIRPASASVSLLQDRRLLVGGAIASGVSIAGAAVIAWRRSRAVERGPD